MDKQYVAYRTKRVLDTDTYMSNGNDDGAMAVLMCSMFMSMCYSMCSSGSMVLGAVAPGGSGSGSYSGMEKAWKKAFSGDDGVKKACIPALNTEPLMARPCGACVPKARTSRT